MANNRDGKHDFAIGAFTAALEAVTRNSERIVEKITAAIGIEAVNAMVEADAIKSNRIAELEKRLELLEHVEKSIHATGTRLASPNRQLIRLFGCYWETVGMWTRDTIPTDISLHRVTPLGETRKRRKEMEEARRVVSERIKKRKPPCSHTGFHGLGGASYFYDRSEIKCGACHAVVGKVTMQGKIRMGIPWSEPKVMIAFPGVPDEDGSGYWGGFVGSVEVESGLVRTEEVRREYGKDATRQEGGV